MKRPEIKLTRTAMQASPAWLITEGIDALVYDMTDRQFGAVVGLLTMAFAYIHAAIENKADRTLPVEA